MALPVGEYELEDSRVLVVSEEGLIDSIKEATKDIEKVGDSAKKQSKVVQGLKNSVQAVGTALKALGIEEFKSAILSFRINIKKGEKFSKENITSKRTSSGISIENWNDVIGKEAEQDFSKDSIIKIPNGGFYED